MPASTLDQYLTLVRARNAADDRADLSEVIRLTAAMNAHAARTRSLLRARGETPLSERFPRAA